MVFHTVPAFLCPPTLVLARLFCSDACASCWWVSQGCLVDTAGAVQQQPGCADVLASCLWSLHDESKYEASKLFKVVTMHVVALHTLDFSDKPCLRLPCGGRQLMDHAMMASLVYCQYEDSKLDSTQR